MTDLTVAIVTDDPDLRLAVAREMDAAPPGWDVRFAADSHESADVLVVERGREGRADVLFDMDDVSTLVERITERSQRDLQRLVVVTGLRGAGVTSVALHLAAACAYRDVCFLDLDRTWGAATRVSAEQAARWSPDGDVRAVSVPLSPGFDALISPVGHSATDAREVVECVRRAYTKVVADVPNDSHLSVALGYASGIVCLFPATIEGAARAARLAESFPDIPCAFVANRAGSGGESSPERLAAALGHRLALQLPHSPALRDAEDDSTFVTSPLSPWRWKIRMLARGLGL